MVKSGDDCLPEGEMYKKQLISLRRSGDQFADIKSSIDVRELLSKYF